MLDVATSEGARAARRLLEIPRVRAALIRKAERTVPPSKPSFPADGSTMSLLQMRHSVEVVGGGC